MPITSGAVGDGPLFGQLLVVRRRLMQAVTCQPIAAGEAMLWFTFGCAIAAAAGVAWATLALLWRIRDTIYAADDAQFIVSGIRAELVQQKEAADRGWWAVLGVQPDATREQVDLAYRALLKARHPDLNQRDGAGLDVQQLQRARLQAQLELRRRAWWADRAGR